MVSIMYLAGAARGAVMRRCCIQRHGSASEVAHATAMLAGLPATRPNPLKEGVRSAVKGFARAQLVRRANEWAALLRMEARARFEVGNATVSLGGLLATYPGPLRLVTILASGLAPALLDLYRPTLMRCQAPAAFRYTCWSSHTSHDVLAASTLYLVVIYLLMLYACPCTY